MNVSDYLEQLRSHGAALAAAADRAGLDTEVPSCPGWQVRDVVGHTGGVHRWATRYVAEGDTEPPGGNDLAPPPADGELLDWFAAGLSTLADTIEAAPADLECWTFLPAPTPLTFWARRQAHETAVHRIDVENAGGESSELGTRFAVDGIDELLLGFFARPRGRLIADPPTTLGVHCVDGGPGDEWTVAVGPSAREVTRGVARGDCVVSGPADRLYRLLWNRGGTEAVHVAGDAKVLDLWRERARVAW